MGIVGLCEKMGRMPRAKKGTLNVTSGGFISRGDTSSAREVYASQISSTTVVGKHQKMGNDVVIPFSELEMENVLTAR